MKKLLIFSLAVYVGYAACKGKSNTDVANDNTKSNDARVDSLKWLFYAYTFNSKAIFSKDQKMHEFPPTECAIEVERAESRGDSLICRLKFKKDGFVYSHITEGLPVSGFILYSGIAKPLTGSLVLDNFDNDQYVKNDNRKTDSAFRAFLQSSDRGQLSDWLTARLENNQVNK